MYWLPRKTSSASFSRCVIWCQTGIAAVASKTHTRENPIHRRISKVGKAIYRSMPK